MKTKFNCNCGYTISRTGKDAVKMTSGKAKIKPNVPTANKKKT